MTTSERIEVLLEDLQLLQFGIRPGEVEPGGVPKFCVLAKQNVQAGTNSADVDHKVMGESVVDCLEQLQNQVNGAKGIKPKKLSPILTRGGLRE